MKKNRKKKWLSVTSKTLVVLMLAGGLYYKAAEYPMAAQIEEGKKTVACVGDSITFGQGVPLIQRDELSYPAFLEAMITEDTGDCYQVLNYGLCGRTLLDEGNKPYREESFYDTSREANADVYIIMLGSNDSKDFNWIGNEEKYEEELQTFVEEYQNLESHPVVYLMQPPKAFSTSEDGSIKYDIRDDVIAAEIHEAVARVGEKTGVTVIDLYELTEDHPEWYADGVHPNEIGNEAIAELVYSYIKQNL